METIAFYSLCFCLSSHVWHDQIIQRTVVIYPNNFKCHGTIFAIFYSKNHTTFWSKLTKSWLPQTFLPHDTVPTLFQYFFLKENPFKNVFCKMLAIYFRPKYRLIWCLFFIKVYHQPKLKREIVHISKFQNKILYQSKITWYILNFIEALAGSQMKVKAVLNIFF